MFKGVLLSLLLASCQLRAADEKKPLGADTARSLSASTLYILFLNSHAHTLHAVSAPNAGARAARAAQLHVRVSELDSIDRAAAMFSSQEESLREEALRYVKATDGAHQAHDPAIIHSFTMRREALASDALDTIHTQLSPASYAGLQRYVESQLRGRVHQLR
jgi:hypothetical protein